MLGFGCWAGSVYGQRPEAAVTAARRPLRPAARAAPRPAGPRSAPGPGPGPGRPRSARSPHRSHRSEHRASAPPSRPGPRRRDANNAGQQVSFGGFVAQTFTVGIDGDLTEIVLQVKHNSCVPAENLVFELMSLEQN